LILPALPIDEFIPQITAQLSLSNNLVLQAEPGAGKSTALPLSLLNEPWLAGRKILMLEPRRVAAKSIANYLASQLGESVGQKIGYQIKNERKISPNTVLEVVTEGILTRRLQNDPEMTDIGLIIFDEFHERSIHADLALLLSLEIQQTIRDDLRLLVMSATIDTRKMSDYMGGAKVIECPGRAFPVSIEYLGAVQNRDRQSAGDKKAALSRHVSTALGSVLRPGNRGDVLVFLPGQGEINRCIADAKSLFSAQVNLLFLPLYGGLSLSQQEQALAPDPSGRRRVVFTTNIAETSLTIAGVRWVIDSGLEKLLVYDPTSGMTRLETAYISKASAVQRAGRAGRTQAGACVRLWNEQKQSGLRDYQGEEILSTDLSALVLDLLIWGARDYDSINWLTPPPQPHFEAAQMILQSLGLTDSGNKVTALGESAAKIGLTPRLAAMLLSAQGTVEKGIAVELAALLADRDIFYQYRGVDITDRLLALQDYKKSRARAMQAYPIKQASIEQLLSSAAVLSRQLKTSSKTALYTLVQLQDIVGKLLLFAYPDRLAKQRANSGRYQLANGRGVFLFEDDPLFGSDWLVVSDCDGQKKEGRIFNANAIDYETVVACLENKFVTKEHYDLDKAKQKITGQRVTYYDAISIKSEVISKIPKEKFQQCLQQILPVDGLELFNWTDRCESWLARAQWLGEQLESFPQLSKSQLQATLADWLLPYIGEVTSIAGLRAINLYDLLTATLTWEQQQILTEEAPTEYKTPSGKSVPIIYDQHQGPTVSVALQEMFGEMYSPKIGGDKISIRFELLSPARRPIQTTSDLSNFWQTSYFDVAKEMRGRYPRHRWPDEPLLEKAGKSIKRKKGE
jgi:ATP-dependent helicase HrpB